MQRAGSEAIPGRPKQRQKQKQGGRRREGISGGGWNWLALNMNNTPRTLKKLLEKKLRCYISAWLLFREYIYMYMLLRVEIFNTRRLCSGSWVEKCSSRDGLNADAAALTNDATHAPGDSSGAPFRAFNRNDGGASQACQALLSPALPTQGVQEIEPAGPPSPPINPKSADWLPSATSCSRDPQYAFNNFLKHVSSLGMYAHPTKLYRR